jgi:hypothetical protein
VLCWSASSGWVMTKMSDSAEQRRETVENALFRASRMRSDLELAHLRVNQAMQHYPAARRLLQPVSEYLLEWERHLASIKSALQRLWEDGNEQHWK